MELEVRFTVFFTERSTHGAPAADSGMYNGSRKEPLMLTCASQVLTGATGSLGAHILQQLVSSPSVARVICLSRAQSHDDSLARLQESLRLRQLSLTQQQWGKVTSFSANVNEDRLGLSPDDYGYVVSHTTAIIHVCTVLFSIVGFALIVVHGIECVAGQFQHERRILR